MRYNHETNDPHYKTQFSTYRGNQHRITDTIKDVALKCSTKCKYDFVVDMLHSLPRGTRGRKKKIYQDVMGYNDKSLIMQEVSSSFTPVMKCVCARKIAYVSQKSIWFIQADVSFICFNNDITKKIDFVQLLTE